MTGNRKAAITAFFGFVLLCFAVSAHAQSGVVAINVQIPAHEKSGKVRLYLPYPVSDEFQSITDMSVKGNFSDGAVYREKDSGNLAFYAEWKKPRKERFLTMSFKVSARENVKKTFPSEYPGIPVEVLPYLEETAFIPTDGLVKETSLSITKGKTGINEKARAVYEWVVENTFRDPNVKGCGIGDVEKTLAVKGGKCVDISSVFVALARAAGVPAREVFGLRLSRKPKEDMTNGYHCWAEFYQPGYGWVPVDPADVRKAIFEQGDAVRDKYSEYFFGAVDEYRMALARGGRGYYLNPRQKAGPINYFMYPYAEVEGRALDWLDQKELRYSVSFEKTR